jgi:hypothetical protein
MVAPTPMNPPGVTKVAQSPGGLVASVPRSARTAGHFLRSFGFHVVAVLLGIALAFL